MKTVTVKAPATIANLVCGFDILGLCTELPYDLMEVRLRTDRQVHIHSSNGFLVPADPAMNTAGAPLLEMIKELDQDIGFDVFIQKNIKPGSGIGSSAASAAGAIVAANYLLNQPYGKEDLVRLAMYGEKVASGVKHADNIAPCIYGGIALIRSIFPLDIIAIPAPHLHITMVHPQIEVRTADARQILRKEVLLKDAVKQWGNIAGLVTGLMKEDYDLIGRSLEDVIIEPIRSILIPGFKEVKNRSLKAGALGGGISGSGPSVFMLSADANTAAAVAKEMEVVYQQLGIPAHTYTSTINYQGVSLVDETRNNMLYYSTNNRLEKADFRTATIKGQAPDKGLYFPEQVPQLPASFIKELRHIPKEEVALQVIRPYVQDTIPPGKLSAIVSETIAFDFPLVAVTERSYALELFHGPTLAFKDVGARFMSRCLGYFMQHQDKRVTVLVATSGDTGGAVAHGFYNVDGVDVVILYPSKKVSSIQELQLTTLGNNITAIEVDGTFDDCQQLVKQAFTDRELNERLFLTSANSINVARWLPQQFYYFFALQQWPTLEQPPVIAVPSGNFGNICAGLLAQHSGLPVRQFIAACNVNDVVSNYLQTGIYTPKAAVPTLSNAMDVGHPSNWVRILELFEKNIASLKEHIHSYCVSDADTQNTIAQVYAKNHYLLDPHGAVGYIALEQYLQHHPEQKGLFLATAHPVKFYDVAETVIGEKVSLPPAVQHLLAKEKVSLPMKPDSELLRAYLLNK